MVRIYIDNTYPHGEPGWILGMFTDKGTGIGREKSEGERERGT
jgi:hypothetical protein